jgi:carboxymethylenebutenolidase
MSDETTIETSWIQIPVASTEDGGTAPMEGYLARPSGPGPWPGVLVGFEMFGITGFVRSVTDRLASAGYLALAPDFYHWQGGGGHVELPADADGRARGLELLNGLSRKLVRADVHAAIKALAARPGSTGQAAFFGMSAGGHIAFYAASQIPLSALVCLYPGWLADAGTGLSKVEPLLTLTPRIAGLGTPVLFLAGADDHLFKPGHLDEIRAGLAEAGVRHEMIIYPDTPHGFFCHERDTYRPLAADDAWARATKFLSAEFG